MHTGRWRINFVPSAVDKTYYHSMDISLQETHAGAVWHTQQAADFLMLMASYLGLLRPVDPAED
jgi:hypothetical protein